MFRKYNIKIIFNNNRKFKIMLIRNMWVYVKKLLGYWGAGVGDKGVIVGEYYVFEWEI